MADVYGAITDDAVNRIIGFVHARAPFLFNYVAPSLQVTTDAHGNMKIQDLWLTCSDVPDSPLAGVPKYTRVAPFRVPPFPVGLPYCVQIIDAKIDFHPGDILTLPAELDFPLREQSFALMVLLNFGLACLPPSFADALAPGSGNVQVSQLPVLPVTQLLCFDLQIFAEGHLTVTTTPQPGVPVPLQQIHLEVDGLEILDLAPSGLEEAVECYLTAVLKGYLLPRFVLGLQDLAVKAVGLTFTPHLTPGLAHDPAIEQNELRVWLDLDLS